VCVVGDPSSLNFLTVNCDSLQTTIVSLFSVTMLVNRLNVYFKKYECCISLKLLRILRSALADYWAASAKCLYSDATQLKVDCCRNRQQIGNKVDCCRIRSTSLPITVDYVASVYLRGQSHTVDFVDFEQSRPHWIQLCRQCVPGLRLRDRSADVDETWRVCIILWVCMGTWHCVTLKLASTVQYLERSQLLLVISASDLAMRCVQLNSVLLSSA